MVNSQMLIHHLPRMKVLNTQFLIREVGGIALRATSLRSAPRSTQSTQFPALRVARCSPPAPPPFRRLAPRLPPTFSLQSLQLCQIVQATSSLTTKSLLSTHFVIHHHVTGLTL